MRWIAEAVIVILIPLYVCVCLYEKLFPSRKIDAEVDEIWAEYTIRKAVNGK
tara:strand:+ start:248 stop:403 length:156 start_codon:yes stop_codon:yes gene_type:complete